MVGSGDDQIGVVQLRRPKASKPFCFKEGFQAPQDFLGVLKYFLPQAELLFDPQRGVVQTLQFLVQGIDERGKYPFVLNDFAGMGGERMRFPEIPREELTGSPTSS